MHPPLIFDGLQYSMYVRIQHHSTHDNLIQNVVHSIRMKDQIQLADVLETLVERLDKDLNEIQNPQITLLRIDRKDKVQRRVMPINQLDVVAPFWYDALEVIAERVGAGGDLRKDAANDGLLVRHRVVELRQAGFTVVVDDDDALDHGGGGGVLEWDRTNEWSHTFAMVGGGSREIDSRF